MWFKNLRIYRFLRQFELDAETLAKQLEQRPFRECGRVQESSFGFVPPVGDEESPLVHATNGFLLMAACREERILPTSVVKEEAALRIEKMEQERGLQVPKRERDRVHDCLLYTSPSPRDATLSRMPSSA